MLLYPMLNTIKADLTDYEYTILFFFFVKLIAYLVVLVIVSMFYYISISVGVINWVRVKLHLLGINFVLFLIYIIAYVYEKITFSN